MGANSSDDHEQQLVKCLNADNIIDQQQQFQQHVVNTSSSIIIRFKCNFCDRGFSNAQALGGHMNVHRRDRAAKFNASSTSSSDTTTTQHHHHHHHHHNQSQLLPWNISSSIQDHKEYCQGDQEKQEDADNIHLVRQQYHNPQQQLPLFVDTVVQEEGENDPKEDHEVTITKRQLIMHQSSSSHGHDHDHLADNHDMELDLELRLGPDPEDGNQSVPCPQLASTTRD